nr:protein arginine N-methyltransferase 1.5 isoform X1 [Tanacetum cinerariifolium]
KSKQELAWSFHLALQTCLLPTWLCLKGNHVLWLRIPLSLMMIPKLVLLMARQCSCSSQGAESDHVSITTSGLENECPSTPGSEPDGVAGEDSEAIDKVKCPASGNWSVYYRRKWQKEIQSLLKNGPVSNFAHRNRLQTSERKPYLL